MIHSAYWMPRRRFSLAAREVKPPNRSILVRCSGRTVAPGAALLEVVISVSILLVAMAVVGATFHQGMHSVVLAERMNQADTLTDRLLAELDMGLMTVLQPVEAGAPTGANQNQGLTGYFDIDAPPGLSWKIEAAQDIELPGLVKVAVHIYEGDPEGSEKEQVRLMSTFLFRAVPRNINSKNDLGLSEEQLTLLTDAIPGGAAVFDPTNFDPRSIAQLDLETLRELLPALIAALGGGALGGGQLDALLQAAQSGDTAALQGLGGQLGNLGEQGGAGLPGLTPPTGGPAGAQGAGTGQRPQQRGTGQRPQQRGGARRGS